MCDQAFNTSDGPVVGDFDIYFTNKDGRYVVYFSHNVLGQRSYVDATPYGISGILCSIQKETNGSTISATLKFFDP